jgi:PAS domain S-box-containing protein
MAQARVRARGEGAMTEETWLSPAGGVDVGPRVIFGMDRDGLCTLSVGPGLAALGLRSGELVGQNLYAVYRDDPLGTEALTRSLAGESFSGEREYLGRRLALHFEPIVDGDGTVVGAVGIATDVTEQRRAEQAARAARGRERELAGDLYRFKALVEASPDFVAIAALDGRVQYVNPGGRALVGMPPDLEVERTTIADYLTPEGLVASIEVEQPAVVRDGHWEGVTTLRHMGGGDPIPVAVASFLMRDIETGEPFALATVQRDLTERVRSEAALRELVEQRSALLSRLVDAQDAERTRIAADVHDDPVQAVAAVELRLGVLRRRLREQAPDLLGELDGLRESVQGATERLRSLLFDLEPPDLSGGLAAALRVAADEILQPAGVSFTVDGGAEPTAPEATRATAYRVAKEALVNVAKHARASAVDVVADAHAGGLRVRVHDDGIGVGELTSSPPGHRGVSGMRDRATLAGGWCTVGGDATGGTTVTLWLPHAAT